MRQFIAISRITFSETVRQPVYALMLTCTYLFIALTPAFAAHIFTFGAGTQLEQAANRMVADLGLSTVLLSGLILSVFASSSVISREIENKTALTILSKKVSRMGMVLGKYAGVALAIALAGFSGLTSVMLIVRSGPTVAASERMDYGVLVAMAAINIGACIYATFRNYYRGRAWIGSYTCAFLALCAIAFVGFALFDTNYDLVFMAKPGDGLNHRTYNPLVWTTYDWDVFRAGVLTIMAILALTSVSVAASTRFNAGTNFAICAIFFLGGLTSEYFHNLFQSSIPAKLWFMLMPNMQLFWMSEALTREKPIPNSYLLYSGGYAICYIVAMLFLASFLFQKRDVS